MLGSFIAHGLTKEEAESETLVQMYVPSQLSKHRVLTFITSLAGSDTTASATRAILLHVVTNPPVLERLLEEISQAEISSPIKDSEAKRMPYLQAVIKEGLRIHPPVTGLMLKEVPPGGDNVLGHYLPAQTKLGYCAFGLFLDPKLWGQDSKVYRPERWLEGSPEEIRRKENDMDLVFGWGRSQCLGKTVAAIELNKIIVEVSMNDLVHGSDCHIDRDQIRKTKLKLTSLFTAPTKFQLHHRRSPKALELLWSGCFHRQ
jgi:cytochrome P450